MLTRRSWLMALGAGTGLAWLPRAGTATLARPVSLRELVLASRHALLAVPDQMVCLREQGRYGSRLVTHTTLRVTRSVDGRPPPSERLVVRTLGGRLDGVGELAHGEAVPRLGKEALLFLHPVTGAVYGVTGMAQGHYPLVRGEAGQPLVHASPNLPGWAEAYRHLLPDAAVVKLDGQAVPAVERLIEGELYGHAPR